jgi:hypothetical protein
MKIKDVPIEKGRIPLDQLADFMKAHGYSVPFIALDETYVEATKDKTGGLKINLWTGVNFTSKYDINKKMIVREGVLYEDGLQLTQKYSKISSGMLTTSLASMGYEDTEELQKHFFDYELMAQRNGFPRLIPQKVNPKEPEKPKA